MTLGRNSCITRGLANGPVTKMQTLEPSGIRFPDFKSCGVSLRSQRMKLPNSLGQKKSKGIEQTLIEMKLDLNPPPTEEICSYFNELRSDIVFHYELKAALENCDYEFQSLKHQLQALNFEVNLDF
ncbi:hypothetical protein QAD02_003602 [Eretmocerus hayati]|uniref:Uncharacterized protein n=1 Tax=Eretmocerus hayati TaxID=131215 RepID=A0ACC2NN95_9HYME|nr:hypothetical protein QAD02_003602 [Eretmocerus hayati]